MNDFLIHFGGREDGRVLEGMLRNRPGVLDHPVLTFDFPWGRVAIQPPRAPGYAPLRQGETLTACVGRPRFMGVEHESLGGHGFNQLVRDRLRTAGPQALGEALTGMFALLECTTGRARVMTDAMGFMPVYAAHDEAGRVVAVGTHLDSVAALAGRAADFDPVSLGELLVHQYVSFPYTTRRGVTQLGPASLTEFMVGPGGEVRGADVRTTVLWEPLEPAPGDVPPAARLEEELEQAVRDAAADVARGASRVAPTLSGGLDSRLVLAVMGPQKLAGAITYATRENHEVDVARRLAAARGVPHYLAWRNEEFYAELMPRAVGLLGTELRGDCHGFCISDNGLDREFDLVVGGFFSDTLLKGHYMPSALRERVRRRSPYYRLKRATGKALRKVGVLPRVKPQAPHFWDLARGMESRLGAEIRQAVRERRAVRLEQVRRVRPQSAEEWVRFWPGSRGDGAYGPQANTRLFTSDELFFHRRVVELAARVPLHEKLGGRLTKRVFPRLYGELGEIENAATGLPATVPNANRRQDGADDGSSSGSASTPRSRFPWNDVRDSWVDWELLQKHSPTWSSYRAALADSPALDVLDGVLSGGAGEFIEGYRDEAGHLFNRAALQLAYAIDRTLHHSAQRATQPAQPAATGSAGNRLVPT